MVTGNLILTLRGLLICVLVTGWNHLFVTFPNSLQSVYSLWCAVTEVSILLSLWSASNKNFFKCCQRGGWGGGEKGYVCLHPCGKEVPSSQRG